MIPLPTNQQALKWLCIQPLDADENQRKKILYVIFSLAVFALNLFGFGACGVNFWKSVSIDLHEAVFVLFQLSCAVGVTYVCIVTFLDRDKITALLGTLSRIYSARKHLFEMEFF